MKHNHDNIKSVLIILLVWLFAGMLFYLVIFKLKFLMGAFK
jgi:hypothetical protein